MQLIVTRTQPDKTYQKLRKQNEELITRIDDIMRHVVLDDDHKPCIQCRQPCLYRDDLCDNCYGGSHIYGEVL